MLIVKIGSPEFEPTTFGCRVHLVKVNIDEAELGVFVMSGTRVFVLCPVLDDDKDEDSGPTYINITQIHPIVLITAVL